MSASLDLSLIVHTRNRREMLHPLLRSTAFIGERIIVDMASDDGSAELCEEAGCRVVRIPAETFVDELRNRYLPLATRGWTLLLDSDEYLSADAEGLIAALIAAAGDRIDAYGIPRFNYIGADRPLLRDGIRTIRSGCSGRGPSRSRRATTSVPWCCRETSASHWSTLGRPAHSSPELSRPEGVHRAAARLCPDR